ncbi:MAG: Rho termination factor N-terminal domain-containing protein [Balneolaceae bacterium]
MAEEDKKYNKYKEYKGKRYSGMKVGGTHKWYYDKGEWKERKKTPEEWDVFYKTTKRRAGKAPEKSGAPVGTAYNWLIVAHQRVDKLDANSYMTYLDGKKFKVSHLRASKGKWNVKEKTQRKKVIEFLEQVIEDIKSAGEDEEIPYSVNEEERIYGLKHMTKKELNVIASERDISGRSKLKRDELLDAIVQDIKQNGAA